MDLLRIFWVCFNPFFKRLVYFEPVTYKVMSILVLISSIGIIISKKGLLLGFFLSTYLLLVSPFSLVDFLPFILLCIFLPTFKRVQFNKTFRSFLPLFFLITFYAIYQKVFGYTSVELNWIKAGAGAVSEVGYFIRDDVRPLSFLAGTPELSLFFCIYFYYFLVSKNKLGMLLSFSMLLVSGSRGVLVAFIISVFFLFVKKHIFTKIRYSMLLFYALLFNALSYFTLTLIGPVIAALAPDQRMFVFGTFNARVETLIEFFISNYHNYFLIPFADHEKVYDNAYLTFISIFSISLLPFFLYFFIKKCQSEKFFIGASLALGYAFYADLFYSYYAMFFIFVVMFSQERGNRPL